MINLTGPGACVVVVVLTMVVVVVVAAVVVVIVVEVVVVVITEVVAVVISEVVVVVLVGVVVSVVEGLFVDGGAAVDAGVGIGCTVTLEIPPIGGVVETGPSASLVGV